MRRLSFLFSMVVCCGLAVGGGLVACEGEAPIGGEKGLNCGLLCAKALGCWDDDVPDVEDYIDCLVMCNTASTECRECAADCSLDLPCEEYEECMDRCPNCPDDDDD